MQISIFWTIHAKTASLTRAVDSLGALHNEGFRRVWTPQMPNEPDALTMITAAGLQVPEIGLGTAVLPMQTQHPMNLAQRALTVNSLLHGRLSLGLGLSHQLVTEGMWGVPYSSPVKRTNEFLDGLLPLLAGDKVSAKGDFTTTRGQLSFVDAPEPEVYLAALGPKMLEVAGRRTRGTITWMTGPQTLATHIIPSLRAAADDAGREAGSVRTVAALPVCVTPAVDEARERASRAFAIYDTLPSYRAMLDREGYTHAWDAAIIGDADFVASQIRAIKDLGVDEFVAIDFARDGEERARTRDVLRGLDDA